MRQFPLIEVAAVFALTGAAVAGPTARYDGQPFQTGNGGPFRFHANSELAAIITNEDANRDFLSFCLEGNEYISAGTEYNVTIDLAAIRGGNGGPNPDPLDARTAFLFQHYVNGDLNTIVPGFAYNDGPSGAALQNAIWYIEQEIGSLPAGLATSLEAAAASAVAGAWGNTIGNVRVANLWDSNNTACQSQLVIIPLPSHALMAGAGLLGLAWVRRRRL